MKIKEVLNRFFHVYAITRVTMIVFMTVLAYFAMVSPLKDIKKIPRDDADKKKCWENIG
jgi:hypothetical protein